MTTIAERLSSAKRAELQTIPAAEAAAELAAVDAWLAVNGWTDWSGNEVAQCPRCASVATRFVSRALREGGPRVLRCVDCALAAMQT